MKPFCLALIFSMCLALMVACQSDDAAVPNVECSDISEDYLQPIPFNTQGGVQLTDWITSTFEISASAISPLTYANSLGWDNAVYWDSHQRSYSANFRGDQFVHLGVDWEKTEPNLYAILACYGPPNFYRAVYQQDIEARILIVRLWYVDKGMMIMGSRISSTPVLTPSLEMDLLYIVKPTTLEAMIPKVILGANRGNRVSTIINDLKPWPSDGQMIVDNEVK